MRVVPLDVESTVFERRRAAGERTSPCPPKQFAGSSCSATPVILSGAKLRDGPQRSWPAASTGSTGHLRNHEPPPHATRSPNQRRGPPQPTTNPAVATLAGPPLTVPGTPLRALKPCGWPVVPPSAVLRPRRQRQRLSTPRSGAPALATLSSRRCGDQPPTLCQPTHCRTIRYNPTCSTTLCPQPFSRQISPLTPFPFLPHRHRLHRTAIHHN